MAKQRLATMKLHALLAGFFLPIGVMFFIAGALYTWGTKGGYDTATDSLPLSAALNPEGSAGMLELVVAQLAQRDLAHSNGGYGVKSAGTSIYFE